MKLQGRKIYPGNVRGEALVSTQAISFYGGVDPETGMVVERGHELEGRSIAGKVLVFPTGKGSTVGSYTLYRLKAEEKAPLAIVNAECETITAVGCIIAEIPCVDRVDLSHLQNGQVVAVDGEDGEVRILQPANQPPPALRQREGHLHRGNDAPAAAGLGRSGAGRGRLVSGVEAAAGGSKGRDAGRAAPTDTRQRRPR